MAMRILGAFGWALVLLVPGADAAAQVDQAKAAAYFQEAAAICQRDAGELWGVSLCGPLVFADAATRTIATNDTVPPAARPPALGFANAPMMWGGRRWATMVWSLVPTEANSRARLMLHELFHRVQPDLGLFVQDAPSDHLDTVDGRVLMRLEWRALRAALDPEGDGTTSPLADALAFRARRRGMFPSAAASERPSEINEGLAQYTGTVLANPTRSAAVADARAQLESAERAPTYVRTFANPTGAAYGLILDQLSTEWRRRIKGTDDLGDLAARATNIGALPSFDVAAARYGVTDLSAEERDRAQRMAAEVARLRMRYVDGPTLTLPNGRNNTYTSANAVPIPGAGTVLSDFRTSAEWGTLEANQALLASDRSSLKLPAPADAHTSPVRGEGWTLTIAAGWKLVAGPRPSDYQLVREKP